MSDECIHGFDVGQCATCFPQEPPQSETAATPVRRKASRTSRPALGSAKHEPEVVDLGQRRLYHVSHIDNLDGILEHGALLADADLAGGGLRRVDISSSAQRDRRRQVLVAGHPVSAYVPFFLTPDADTWTNLRIGSRDSRLSPAAYEFPPSDYVVFVTTIDRVRPLTREKIPVGFAVADDDSADDLARIETSETGVNRAFQRFDGDDGRERARVAEALVAESVPLGAVSLVGVANIRVRERVKDALTAAGQTTKVAAYTPWFE
ncbi:hypothetical protein GCM10027416_15350 [Okibacterium endophyticum]